MESDDVLRDLNRAAARPFIDYPRPPWWYPVLMGGFFSAIAAALVLLSRGNIAAAIALEALALLALGTFFGWYRSRWGTWPQMREAPAEIRRAYHRYFARLFVVVVLVVAAGFLSPPVATVVVTFLAFTALFWWYERKVYPAACADVRARLA